MPLRLAVFALCLVGCSGLIEEPWRPIEPPPPDPFVCEEPAPDAAAQPLRRLTREEYDHAVRDLLGDASAPAAAFTPDDDVGGFHNNLTPVGELQLERYLAAAETLAGEAVARGEVIPCDPALIGARGCAEQLIDEVGLRAFRRPVSPEEHDALLALYDHGATESFEHGVELVLQALLQSPHFLYHVELGGEADPDGLSLLPPYELASRLSFFLWTTIPDQELLDAAASGGLDSPEEVEAQARRMIGDRRARDAIGSFHRQWLGLSELDFVVKDAEMFPEYDADMVAAMQEEAEMFSYYVVYYGDAYLDTLLTADWSLVPPELEDVYGVSPGPEAETFFGLPVVETGPGRSGVLTLPGVMAAHSHPNGTSPTFRGKLIRERFLCTSLPEPPNNVDITLPDIGPDATLRERLELHRSDAACASCHELMDPIGFAFEHFDAVGRYRTMEGTHPVDARGELMHTHDADGAFDGAQGLGAALANSDQVRQCYVTQWFRYALPRGDRDEDTCSRGDVYERFEGAGWNIRELMVALTQTDAFLYHRAAE